MKRWIVMAVGLVVLVVAAGVNVASALVLHDRLGTHPDAGDSLQAYWSGAQWGLEAVNGELDGSDAVWGWVNGLTFLGCAGVVVATVGALVWVSRTEKRAMPAAASAP